MQMESFFYTWLGITPNSSNIPLKVYLPMQIISMESVELFAVKSTVEATLKIPDLLLC